MPPTISCVAALLLSVSTYLGTPPRRWKQACRPPTRLRYDSDWQRIAHSQFEDASVP